MSSKERRDDSFIKKPVYPGGNAAIRKFIKDNLKYPETAIDKKVEGTVHLKYTIDHKGKVVETKVVKGIGHGCDAEAERILKLLKFEIPKNPRKLRVTFHNKTQITFKLPIAKKASTPAPTPTPPSATTLAKAPPISGPTRARYVYIPTVKKSIQPQKKAKNVYTYTISGVISGNITDLME